MKHRTSLKSKNYTYVMTVLHTTAHVELHGHKVTPVKTRPCLIMEGSQ